MGDPSVRLGGLTLGILRCFVALLITTGHWSRCPDCRSSAYQRLQMLRMSLADRSPPGEHGGPSAQGPPCCPYGRHSGAPLTSSELRALTGEWEVDCRLRDRLEHCSSAAPGLLLDYRLLTRCTAPLRHACHDVAAWLFANVP